MAAAKLSAQEHAAIAASSFLGMFLGLLDQFESIHTWQDVDEEGRRSYHATVCLGTIRGGGHTFRHYERETCTGLIALIMGREATQQCLGACKQHKTLDQYARNKNGPNGYNEYCKRCERKRVRSYDEKKRADERGMTVEEYREWAKDRKNRVDKLVEKYQAKG